jgi:hypothetical protein
MAQSSVRGACGFVQVGNTDISIPNYWIAGHSAEIWGLPLITD